MTDKPPESCLPEPKNPPRLPPTLAIARTARELHDSWKARAPERTREQARAEATHIPQPPAPKGP